MKTSILLLSLLLLAGCLRPPEGVRPVESFDLGRYLGTWYEIARLDHRFERGLTQVSAHYSPRSDGGITVLNRGYNSRTGEWKEATGRAYPLGEPQLASLKVSFFRPFYGGYHVIELDRDNYGYALVCGPGRDYLWILARTPTLDAAVIRQLVAKAKALGFDTEGLIFVDQQEPPRGD